MAYICYRKNNCEGCEHYRFDPDKQENACFAQADAITRGNDYELAFYRQVNQFDLMCGGSGKALGLAIRAKNGYSDDYGLPEYSIITVNLPSPLGDEPEFIGMKNCAYMDVNNSAALVEKLTQTEFNGEPIAKDTGFWRQSGWVKYPLYQFNEEWLRTLPMAYGALGSYEQYSEQYNWDTEEEAG